MHFQGCPWSSPSSPQLSLVRPLQDSHLPIRMGSHLLGARVLSSHTHPPTCPPLGAISCQLLGEKAVWQSGSQKDQHQFVVYFLTLWKSSVKDVC